MSSLITEIRYSWRALFKRPLLTLTVTTTLALGLGANAAIFNLIDRLVLPAVTARGSRLCRPFVETAPNLKFKKEAVAPANFFDWRAETRTLDFLSASAWWDANLVDRDNPERLPGFLVTQRVLRGAERPTGARSNLCTDDETFAASRRDPERRTVETALRCRPRGDWPDGDPRWRSTSNRRRDAPSLCVP